MLSESLKGVIAQTLLRIGDGKRVAAHEILLVPTAVANLIREGKTFQLPSQMQIGKAQGMRTMNDSIMGFVKSGRGSSRTRAMSRRLIKSACSNRSWRTASRRRWKNNLLSSMSAGPHASRNPVRAARRFDCCVT